LDDANPVRQSGDVCLMNCRHQLVMPFGWIRPVGQSGGDRSPQSGLPSKIFRERLTVRVDICTNRPGM
jgi:hypothetical protein